MDLLIFTLITVMFACIVLARWLMTERRDNEWTRDSLKTAERDKRNLERQINLMKSQAIYYQPPEKVAPHVKAAPDPEKQRRRNDTVAAPKPGIDWVDHSRNWP